MTGRPVVIVDVETTGLDPEYDDVWELAVIHLDSAGGIWSFTGFVEHDTTLAKRLPAPFRADHDRRYDPKRAYTWAEIREHLTPNLAGATLVGAQPWFDAAFLARILGGTPWHYRMRCVESMTAGHLGRDMGGLDDCLAALDLTENAHPHQAHSDAVAALRIWEYLIAQETRR
ncbi:exonuclease domain-containing protein [Tsukamurella sp. 1534]|uniref:exonuclease domain-containing protein n=1 Tax=Tsukamurella sp. 1534 TaxID=1151061 RepID=UPI0002D3F70B|nr:exonuclease domain-containing protein [Tsukamurella sp. 1534]